MCGFLALEQMIEDTSFVADQSNLLIHRGPDFMNSIHIDDAFLSFHRLAIMDLSADGNQPFSSVDNKLTIMCNGEIYNDQLLKSNYPDYHFVSTSDCEVLLPMLLELSLEETCKALDGEFAICGYDHLKRSLFAARDPMGIRPLFYGYLLNNKKIAFASEAKALMAICSDISPFPPGHFYQKGEFYSFHDHCKVDKYNTTHLEDALKNIRNLLEEAVIKRLHADAPLGFLLSGGLDSSLVCAIAAKSSKKPIKTFAIGIKDGPIDTKYAKIVADYIGADHTEVLFSKDDIFEAIDHIVYSLETFDITTIRASVGMYLLCKYIKKNTSIKALMTGEVSDELFGYKYTDFAPNEKEFQDEAAKRIRELYIYDVLRADRCLSAHSIEARVPFSDKKFVDYVMQLDPALKMNTTGIGKYLLRKSFDNLDLLPQDILYRDKAAFSDAVGHSMVDYLKEFANNKYSDHDLDDAKIKYTHATPFTKESLYYRDLFEKYYSGMAKNLIKDFWMPNKSWDNCNVLDPSARVLPNYGKSGE